MHGVNEARVQQWIDALRSGQFQQTQSTLRRIEGLNIKSYCCLGVAQEVALANGYQVPEEVTLYWGEDGMNDTMARDWYGFTSGDPILEDIQDYGRVVTCVRANDDLFWIFAAIANALQARYITPKDPDGTTG